MYKVIRTKHYSIIQALNMAKNLSLKFDRSVSIDRTLHISAKHMNRPYKTTFTIKIGAFERHTLKTVKQLQAKYDKLMK